MFRLRSINLSVNQIIIAFWCWLFPFTGLWAPTVQVVQNWGGKDDSHAPLLVRSCALHLMHRHLYFASPKSSDRSTGDSNPVSASQGAENSSIPWTRLSPATRIIISFLLILINIENCTASNITIAFICNSFKNFLFHDSISPCCKLIKKLIISLTHYDLNNFINQSFRYSLR